MTVHRLTIGMGIALCAAYALFELLHAREHGTARVVAGVAVPLVVATVLAVYVTRIGR